VVTAFRAGGGTVVLTTHYMEEAERLCDRVAVIDHGKIIALGAPQELIRSMGAEHVVEFTVEGEQGAGSGTLGADALTALPGIRGARLDGDRYELTVSEVHHAVPALMAELERRQVVLTNLRTHHATLEDLFLNLTGRHLRDG
jgi:ABC-2 type transport system ATP-binding protein